LLHVTKFATSSEICEVYLSKIGSLRFGDPVVPIGTGSPKQRRPILLKRFDLILAGVFDRYVKNLTKISILIIMYAMQQQNCLLTEGEKPLL